MPYTCAARGTPCGPCPVGGNCTLRKRTGKEPEDLFYARDPSLPCCKKGAAQAVLMDGYIVPKGEIRPGEEVDLACYIDEDQDGFVPLLKSRLNPDTDSRMVATCQDPEVVKDPSRGTMIVLEDGVSTSHKFVNPKEISI